MYMYALDHDPRDAAAQNVPDGTAVVHAWKLPAMEYFISYPASSGRLVLDTGGTLVVCIAHGLLESPCQPSTQTLVNIPIPPPPDFTRFDSYCRSAFILGKNVGLCSTWESSTSCRGEEAWSGVRLVSAAGVCF